MNSSTLRRLAADHASLHTSDLPPHYLFPPSGVDSSIPDDLTQLTILLTGPQGTPYSQGLWRLCLRIPEDYPKNPPKALFKTRIWHPNVEENSGSVCVDTLKKDWESKLTLRDVLITISCLLIHPNPDSALNAPAGHLLQEDYESFARQARLMTSIHASIPQDLKAAAVAARTRGDALGVMPDETEQRPVMKNKWSSSSSVVMKKLPDRVTSTQSVPVSQPPLQDEVESGGEEDETIASKENDPSLSPSPVAAQSPRKPTLPKRPLSDLPCPTEAEVGSGDGLRLGPSEQNIANNMPPPPSAETFFRGPQLVERSAMVNFTGRGLPGTSNNDLPASALYDGIRPAKRVCSDEAKENLLVGLGGSTQPMPVRLNSAPAKVQSAGARKSSALGSVGAGGGRAGKGRVGLKRL